MDKTISQNYGEIWCEAMSELIAAQLEGLAYDITKQYTIVDDSDRENYRYIVSDGSVRFEAYADVNNYTTGTAVYVTIPEGDYNAQKKIIGRQVGANTEPFVYTAPLETMIQIENHVVSNQAHGILANNPDRLVEPVKEDYSLVDCQGFTRLGIKADFKAWLAPMKAVEGDYGIQIILTGEDLDKQEPQTYKLSLTSKDMFNIPYNLETFFTQQKIFDISHISRITNVSIYLFQNNNFYDVENERIPYTYEVGGKEALLLDNIFVKNIELILGYDQNDFDTDSLVLYTKSTLTYTNKATDKDKNKKDLRLRWIHKDPEINKFVLVNNNHINDEKIRVKWYQYTLGTSAADEYCGAHWSIIGEDCFQLDFDPNVLLAEEKIKVIGFVKTEITNKDGSTSIIWEPYYSSILTFKNNSEVINQTTVEATKALSIVYKDNSAGNYFLYNQNNKLDDNSNGSSRTRLLEVYYLGSPLKTTYESDPEQTITVTWHIPKTNSMIIVPNEYLTHASLEEANGVEYYQFEYDASVEGLQFNNFMQEYAIKDALFAEYSNNVIECHVNIDGREYVASAEPRFGKAGTTGTDMTLILNMDNSQKAIVNEVDKTLEVTVYLQDANGELVEPSIYTNKLSFGWYHNENKWFNITQNGNKATITMKAKVSNDNLKQNFHILQAKIAGWANGYDLISFLSIPVTASDTYGSIAGAKEVIYDHQGNPSYTKVPYKLYDKSYNLIGDTSWGIGYPADYIVEHGASPRLKDTAAGKSLQASTFYVKGENDQICVYGYQNNNVLWSQPILIIQNQYDFSMLNSWDGELTIDENNGTILSTMVGAGSKDDQNRFSGVLMGDVQDGTDLSGTDPATGVYGFDKGVISFALKEDGTATFGAAGRGQIKIDGTNGRIKSANFDTDPRGLSLDLDDGLLIIKDAGIERVKMSPGNLQNPDNPEGPRNPYLKISSTKKNTLIHVNDSEYYLQSDGYKEERGTKLNLADGTFDIRNEFGRVTLQSKANSPYMQVKDDTSKNLIYMGNKDYYLQSSNYVRGSADDKYASAAGSKLDLYNGTFTIEHSSGQVYINGNGKNNQPFFRIQGADSQSNRKNLIFIGINNYFLQSINFNSDTSNNYKNAAGSKLNLQNGIFEIYNPAGKVKIAGNGNPYFQVTNSSDNDLIFMGTNNYYLQSKEFTATGYGTKLDLDKGSFTIASSGGSLTLAGKDPFFLVWGKDANNKDVDLIRLGTKQYYLQSVDLKTDSNDNISGTGAKLDLKSGTLLINSANGTVVLSGRDPYFAVQNADKQHLIYMGKDNYYLQSAGYMKENAIDEGIRMDLKNGSLNLISSNGTVSLSKDDTSTNPFFKVTMNHGDGTQRNLIAMGESGYYLQSAEYTTLYIKEINGNWIYQEKNENNETIRVVAIPKDFLDNGKTYTSVKLVDGDTITANTYTFPTTYPVYGYTGNGVLSETKANLTNPRKSYFARLVPVLGVDPSQAGKGLYIDLNKGLINGYDLYLRGMNRDNLNQAVIIDSGSKTTPLTVGDHFKVNWDGTLTCDSINYLGTKPSNGQYIININDHFKVTPGGGVSGSSCSFGDGWMGGMANMVKVHGTDNNGRIAVIGQNNAIYQTNQSVTSLVTGINNCATKASLSTQISQHTHKVTVSKTTAASCTENGGVNFKRINVALADGGSAWIWVPNTSPSQEPVFKHSHTITLTTADAELTTKGGVYIGGGGSGSGADTGNLLRPDFSYDYFG